jgi:hypothetical protein
MFANITATPVVLTRRTASTVSPGPSAPVGSAHPHLDTGALPAFFSHFTDLEILVFLCGLLYGMALTVACHEVAHVRTYGASKFFGALATGWWRRASRRYWSPDGGGGGSGESNGGSGEPVSNQDSTGGRTTAQARTQDGNQGDSQNSNRGEAPRGRIQNVQDRSNGNQGRNQNGNQRGSTSGQRNEQDNTPPLVPESRPGRALLVFGLSLVVWVLMPTLVVYETLVVFIFIVETLIQFTFFMICL